MIGTESAAAEYASSLRDDSPEAVARSIALAEDPELARDARPRSDREATEHVLLQCRRAATIDESALAARSRKLERELAKRLAAVEKAQAEAAAAEAELARVKDEAGERGRLIEAKFVANNNRHARAACRRELTNLGAWLPGWGDA